MEYVSGGPLVSLWAVVCLALTFWACHRTGALLADRLGLCQSSLVGGEFHLFSIGLGLIAFSLSILAAGLSGVLTTVSAYGILIIFIILPFFFKGGSPGAFLDRAATGESGGRVRLILTILSLVALGLSMLQALTPANGVDALAYHLYLPKEFILNKRIFFLPLTRESLWPLQNEMLFTLGLLLQGTATAQLFHWMFYPLSAAAIYLLARRFYDKQTAMLASAIFLLTPFTFAQASYAYVDICLTFFIFVAVYAFLLADTSDSKRFLFLSGLFSGAAAGTKFLGLDCALILFVFILVRFYRKPDRILVFLSGCAAVAAVWYLRSWWIAGNPVYPLYPRFFNGHGYEIDIAAGVGLGKDLLAFLLFPWNMTMYPVSFGGQMLGPLYLLFLPSLIMCVKKIKSHSRYLLIFAVSYCFILFQQSQQARFYISLTPFMAIGTAYGFYHVLLRRGRFVRVLSVAILIAGFCFYLGQFIYRTRDAWAVVSGSESPENYLLTHERSFRGYRSIQENVRPGEKLLNAAEVRYFYAPSDRDIRHLTQVNVALRSTKKGLTQYLNEENFDTIWLVQDSPKELFDYIEAHFYQLLHTYTFKEKPDYFQYSLFRRPSDKA